MSESNQEANLTGAENTSEPANLTYLQSEGQGEGRFAIKSARVVLEQFQTPTEAIILIENGKIFDIIFPHETDTEALRKLHIDWKVEDYQDLVIFPGLIDSNVHLHANYDDDWENIAYCTGLAAAGGVTTIIDNPVLTSMYNSGEQYIESLPQKIEKIQSISKVDFGIYGLLEPKTKNHVEQILNAGALGLKIYLLKSFQNGIGHVIPETVQNLIKDLEKKHPNLLLLVHPETATERELFLTSPCRTENLDTRTDMYFDIKSIENTGAANKGSYLDEYNNNPDDDDDDDSDEDRSPASPESPTKLKGRIMKLREKTEVKALVHFELLSYSRENTETNNDSSSDSDIDMFDKLALIEDSKNDKNTEKNLEVPNVNVIAKGRRKSSFRDSLNIKEGLNVKWDESVKANDDSDPKSLEDSSPELSKNNSSRGSKSPPVKKSRFAKLKVGDLGSERERSPESEKTEGEGNENEGSLFKRLLRVQAEYSEDETHNQEEEKTSEPPSPDQIPKLQTINSEGRVFDSLKKENQLEKNKNFIIKISPNQEKETLSEKNDSRKPSDNTNASPMVSQRGDVKRDTEESGVSRKSSFQGSLGDDSIDSLDQPKSRGPRRPSKFLTIVVNNNVRRNSNPSIQLPDFKESNTAESQQPSQNKSTNSIQFHRSKTNCLKLDTASVDDQPLQNTKSPTRSPKSTVSNLLMRRGFSRQSSNTSTISSPSQISTFRRLDSDARPLQSPPKKENKFNSSYKTFIANRPQNWEENAVSRILSCLKKKTNLRVVFQNLSLASSFLKTRQKKKSSSNLKEKLFCDTSYAYLFFNEKVIKDGETKFKVSPPFRSKENQRLLVETLRLGGIDIISSYHFFVPPQYKQIDDGNFRRAFGGIESMGCSLQAVWTALYHYQQKNNEKFVEDLMIQKTTTNKIIKQMSKMLCSNPAQMLKIQHRKGTIAKGRDADFVIWDPHKVDPNTSLKIYHLFNGKPLLGFIHKTYLRGHLIFDRDQPHNVCKSYNVEFIRP